ncbi:hypothetical protein lerEdw1_015585 [Lerista edwardsae]|nr:hypothetical protein lerEdw1_015585 [Lerista edwardsae]
MNRGSATSRNTKNQDVSHIAFGSKVLGPPPPSGRKFSTRASGETILEQGEREYGDVTVCLVNGMKPILKEQCFLAQLHEDAM